MKDKNVVVLAINLQDSKDQIRKYFEENKFTFTPLMQKSDEISKAYGVSAYPTNYLVGPDGKIAKAFPKVMPKTHDEVVLEALNG